MEKMKESYTPLESVFIDVARLNTRQHKELEYLWDVKIFDRFGIVLQIFKERAKTAEAKIQVELAELPYIRYKLHTSNTHLIPHLTLQDTGGHLGFCNQALFYSLFN